MTRRLDWPGLMRAGMTGLKLPPATFWALTPAELLLMMGLGAVTPPMARARLDELSRAFPDHNPIEDDQDARH
jgi:uncharacterized phage protein (TIGR02216 family)